jgi:hypothetical protein
MKIRVQQHDGSIETISLAGPVSLAEGDILSRITSAEGLEHFFTSDGHYDGWGKICSIPLKEASDLMKSIEQDRDIE